MKCKNCWGESVLHLNAVGSKIECPFCKEHCPHTRLAITEREPEEQRYAAKSCKTCGCSCWGN